MKIPFDIKFRPQIESGEYKVEMGKDNPWPARVVCWDLNGNDLIVIVTNPEGNEEGLIYTPNGKHKAYAPIDSDLFIVTPEQELTEFEKGILDVTKKYLLIPPDSDGVRDRDDQLKWLHETANRLFSIAKKELCKDCAANLEGYIKGRQDALKEREENRVYKHEGPTIPAFWPPCHFGGECTNPFRDCINCPRQSIGINTTTGTSAAKAEGKE